MSEPENGLSEREQEAMERACWDEEWSRPMIERGFRAALAFTRSRALEDRAAGEDRCARCEHPRRFHAPDPERCALAPCFCVGFVEADAIRKAGS